jgi:hypothetical protein
MKIDMVIYYYLSLRNTAVNNKNFFGKVIDTEFKR